MGIVIGLCVASKSIGAMLFFCDIYRYVLSVVSETAKTYGLYHLLHTYKKKGMDMVNMLVLALYTILAMLAINSTIRIPIDNAPTTSFYRYYYSLFTIYLLAAQLEGTKRQVVYYCSIGISFTAAVLFSKNFYFY